MNERSARERRRRASSREEKGSEENVREGSRSWLSIVVVVVVVIVRCVCVGVVGGCLDGVRVIDLRLASCDLLTARSTISLEQLCRTSKRR